MKRILTLILALALVFAFAVPALAENSTGGDVTITTSVGETYTVAIPESKALTWGALETPLGSVTMTAARIEPGAKVHVAVEAGDFKNSLSDATIAYALQKTDDTAFTGVDFTDKDETVELQIAIAQAAWDAAPAGEYEGTITFTVSYVQPPVD